MSIENEFERTQNQLFDTTPIKTVNQQELRENYDGTVFNGMNAVQVEFDGNGNVLKIKSFYAYNNLEQPSFKRYKDSWSGEGGFYDDRTIMGLRLNAIVAATHKDWQLWKNTEEKHPGQSFRDWKKEYVRAMANEAKRLSNELSQS